MSINSSSDDCVAYAASTLRVVDASIDRNQVLLSLKHFCAEFGIKYTEQVSVDLGVVGEQASPNVGVSAQVAPIILHPQWSDAPGLDLGFVSVDIPIYVFELPEVSIDTVNKYVQLDFDNIKDYVPPPAPLSSVKRRVYQRVLTKCKRSNVPNNWSPSLLSTTEDAMDWYLPFSVQSTDSLPKEYPVKDSSEQGVMSFDSALFAFSEQGVEVTDEQQDSRLAIAHEQDEWRNAENMRFAEDLMEYRTIYDSNPLCTASEKLAAYRRLKHPGYWTQDNKDAMIEFRQHAHQHNMSELARMMKRTRTSYHPQFFSEEEVLNLARGDARNQRNNLIHENRVDIDDTEVDRVERPTETLRDKYYASWRNNSVFVMRVLVNSWTYALFWFYCIIFSGPRLLRWLRTYRLYRRSQLMAKKLVQRVTLDINTWKSKFANFTEEGLSAEDKIFLIEIKSAIHVAVHLYSGDRKEAISWASNFGVTRAEWVVYLATMPFDVIKKFYQIPVATAIINGSPMEVDSKTFNAMVNVYEETNNIQSLSDVGATFQSQSGAKDALASLYTMFSKLNIEGMSTSDLKHANDQFAYLNHSHRAAGNVAQSAMDVISVAGRVVFGVDPLDPEYQEYLSKVVDVIKYVHEKEILAEELSKDRRMMASIIEMFEESNHIQLNPRMNTVPRFLSTAFTAAHTKLTAMARRANSELKGAAVRIEPLMVLMTGPPGTGKTAFLNYVRPVLTRMNGGEYESTMTYCFPANSEYWEGYRNQEYVVIDDLWKSNDVKDRRNEAQAIINMVNSTPFFPNMAFDGKGITSFNSSWVFASTNLIGTGINSAKLTIGMTDAKAVLRRVHVAIHKDTPLKRGDDLMTHLYRVDKCPLPQYVGRMLNPMQLTHMLKECRLEQTEASAEYVYTTEQIDAMLAMHVHAPSWKIYTPLELFLTCTELSLYSWTDSVMYPYYIALFVIVLLAAYAVPVYNHFFPFKPQSLHVDWKKQRFEKMKLEAAANKVNWKHANRDADLQATELDGNMGVQSGDFGYMQSLTCSVNKALVRLGARAYNGDRTEEIESSLCLGFHVSDGIICTCAHFFMRFVMHKEVVFYITVRGRSYELEFPTDYVGLEGVDLTFFRLDKTIPRPPGLYSMINPSRSLLAINDGTEMNLLIANSDGTCGVRTVNKAPFSAPVHYEVMDEKILVEHHIAYFEKTIRGNSGAILIAQGPNGKPVIIGVHVGVQPLMNSKEISISIPIQTRMMDVALEYFDVPPHVPPMVKPVSLQSGELQSTEYIYVPDEVVQSKTPGFPVRVSRFVPEQFKHMPPTQSKIRESDLFGWDGEPVCVPANLSVFRNDKDEVVNPLFVALTKVQQQHFPPVDIPDHCLTWLLNMYPRRSEYKSEVLTFYEAANGNPVKRIPAVHMATSAGYPYSLNKANKGKVPYLNRGADGFLSYDEQFFDQLVVKHNMLKAGEKIEVLWADNLKDETRPIDKVQLGKTRLISACPLDYLILTRMYFGDFVSYVQDFASTKPVTVGINPHSADWACLYSRLDKIQGSLISGDFSNFDGKVPKFVSQKFCQFVNRWYDDGPQNARIREILMESTDDAEHIIYNMVYTARGGTPSGHPITSIKNSFVNLIMTYYVLVVCEGLTEEEFAAAVYGDDILLKLARDGYRCEDMAVLYKKHFGMTFTHFSKDENHDHDTLESVRFLGRAFRNHQYAPLAIKTVVESTYWRRGSENKDCVLLSTAETFFLELAHFSEAVFNEYSAKFISAVSVKRERMLSAVMDRRKSYHYYHTRMYDKNCALGPITPYYNTYKLKESGGNAQLSSQNFTKTGTEQVEPFECHSGNLNTSDFKVSDTRNTEFTDRAVNAVDVTQVTQIGTFQDAGPVMNAAVDEVLHQAPHVGFNMETYDMNGSLDRSFPLPLVSWPDTASEGTTLVTYDFPEIIFNQPYISDKLKDFTYFQGAIRLSFRVATNRFLYGYLLAAYDPYPTLNAYSLNSNIFLQGGAPHVIISACASEAVVFDIPFVSMKRALNINSFITAEMGRVYLTVLNPITNVQGEPISAEVFVTAQFMGAKVMLPKPIADPLAGVNYRFENGRFVPVSEESDMVFVTHSGKMASKEGRQKSEKGLISSNLESTVTVPSALKNIRVAEKYVSSIARFGASVGGALGMLGLSKPTTQAMTDVVKISSTSDMTYGKGISLVPKLAMDPENGISTVPNVAGLSHDEMDFRCFMGTPCLVAIRGMVDVTPTTLLAVANIFTDDNPCYADLLAQNFGFWSGSWKVKIYICASLFHTVKVVFWYTDDPSSDNWQNSYHRIVDIQGDTEVEYTLPYSEANIAQSSTVATYYGLYVTILAWSVPVPSVNPPIFFNVYKAAAPDFRVGCLMEKRFVIQHNPRADFASEFPGIHESVTGYVSEGFLYGEEYTTIREIVHRFMPYSTMGGLVKPYNGTIEGTSYRGVEMWGRFFRFQRGSYRIRLMTRDPRYIQVVSVARSGQWIAGNYTSQPSNPVLDVEIPYYYGRLFNPTDDTATMQATDQAVYSSGTAANSTFIFKATGDDHSYHWMRLPPIVAIFTYEDQTHGINGYKAWLQAATPTSVTGTVGITPSPLPVQIVP